MSEIAVYGYSDNYDLIDWTDGAEQHDPSIMASVMPSHVLISRPVPVLAQEQDTPHTNTHVSPPHGTLSSLSTWPKAPE